jgi:hypothetical protein
MTKTKLPTCELCERTMPLIFHHLIPKTTHKKLAKKGCTLEQLSSGVNICRPCHSAIHKLISHMNMAQQYYTLDKLLGHEGVQKWVAYAAKQRPVALDHVDNGLRYRR